MSLSWGRLVLSQVGDRVTSCACYGIWEACTLCVRRYLFSSQTLSVPRSSQRLRLLAPFPLTCGFAACSTFLRFWGRKIGVCLSYCVKTLALERALEKDRRKQSRDLLQKWNFAALVAICPWNCFLPILCLTHNLHRKQNWLGQVCDCSWHFCHASCWMHSLSPHPGCLNILGTSQGGGPRKWMPEEESHRADDCTGSVSRVHCRSSRLIRKGGGQSVETVMQMSERHHLLIWSMNKI